MTINFKFFQDSFLATDRARAESAAREASNIVAGISVNVKSFGAVGDGATDDATAINAAVDFARNNGRRVVYFPDTENGYAVGSPIILYNNITIKGDNLYGGRRSRILPIEGYTGHLVESVNFSTDEDKIFFAGIDGLSFYGESRTQTAVAVRFQQSYIGNCFFRDNLKYGIWIRGKSGNNGLSLNNTIILNYFGKGDVDDVEIAIFQDYYSADTRIAFNYIERCTYACMYIRGSTAIITNNHMFDAVHGIVSEFTFERNISNNFIENMDGAAILIKHGSSSRGLWLTVTSNMFRNINRLDLNLGIVTIGGTGLTGFIVSNNTLRRDTGAVYTVDYFVHSDAAESYSVTDNVAQAGLLNEGQFNLFNNVVNAIPAVDSTKAGTEFYYNGELWRYLTEGETGLPVGTPFPSKGYKEIRCSYFIPAGTGGFANRVLTVLANTTGEDVVVTDVGNASLVIGLSATNLTVNNAIISIPSKIRYSTGIDFVQRIVFTNTGVINLLNIAGDYTNVADPFRYSFTIHVYPPALTFDQTFDLTFK